MKFSIKWIAGLVLFVGIGCVWFSDWANSGRNDVARIGLVYWPVCYLVASLPFITNSEARP